MESPSKMMFDTFKHKIWEELGPLDPNWFDELSLQAYTKNGNICEKEPLLSSNHDGTFKTPLERSAVGSQLFSTPKMFRHGGGASPWPEREDEELSYPEQETETLPWTSPGLFRSSNDGVSFTKPDEDLQLQGDIQLIDTPNKSTVAYAKHISESLGAQLNPDMSWSSSLNTPTATLPPTLILSSKPEDNPVSLTAEKNIVLVRNLFPSLSNVSSDPTQSATKHPTVTQAADGQEDDPVRKSTDSLPESSLDDSGSDWKMTVPDAIEDGEIRRTVESVLDGAENVLSMFFSNSSSALRRVKTKDRIKRKQNISTSENGCASTNTLATKHLVTSEDMAEQRTNEEPDVKTGDIQWTPISLSDISRCGINTPCRVSDSCKQLESRIVTQQTGSESGPSQLVTPSFIKSHSNKKRRFVYTLPSSTSREQGNEKPVQRSTGQEFKEKETENVPDEAQYCDNNKIPDRNHPVQTQTNKTESGLVSQFPEKVQDMDMSQLCRAFAQDFSQMSDSGEVGSREDDKNDFSASACLSALKQKKKSLLQESGLGGTCPESKHISNEWDITNDSGIQSTVVTQVTGSSYVLPSSEKNAECQQSAAGTEKQRHTKNTSIQLANDGNTVIDKRNISNQNGKVHTSIPQQLTVCPVNITGFKTASNRGINISTDNLNRAKSLFKDIMDESLLDKDASKCNFNTGNNIIKSSHPPYSNTKFGDAECSLTASQKAEVTELCCFLEEANSQFEFTQFRPVAISLHSENKRAAPPQQADQELDPDFLVGIDFDESLNCEVEKHLMTPDRNLCKEPSTTSKFKCTAKTENVLTGNEHASEGGAAIVSPNVTTDDFDVGGNGLSLKTAGRNTLQKAKTLFADLEENPVIIPDSSVSSDIVSVHCKHPQPSHDKLIEDFTIKTKHHIEEDMVSTSDICPGERTDVPLLNEAASQFQPGSTQTPPTQLNHTGRNKPVNVKICTAPIEGQTSGFKMASGKDVTISAKAIQDANAFFKDCDVLQSDECGSARRMKKLPPSVTVSGFNKDCNSMGIGPVANDTVLHHEGEPLKNAGPKNPVDVIDAGSSGGNPSLIAKPLSALTCTTLKKADNVIGELIIHGGFATASGKKLSVSDGSLIKAKSLFQDCDQIEHHTEKHHTEKTTQITRPIRSPATISGGFQTATGKGITISTRALQKAKALLDECDEDQDKKTTKPNNIPADMLPLRNCGFRTASGKGLAVSTTALHKAKAMFSDCEEFETIRKNTEDGCELTNDGDKSTACGRSNSLVTKTKPILQEANSFGEQTLNPDAMRASNFTKTIQTPSPRNCGFQTASGKGVSVSTTALQKAKAMFSDCEEFKTKNAEDGCELTNDGDKSTARGRSNSLVAKAKPILQEAISFEEETLHSLPPRNCGFQTASGKGVTVSTTALQKAKAMFSDCGQPKEGTSENTAVKTSIEHAAVNTTVDQLPRNGGFQTASGKGVIISTSALQKAKALLSDCDEDQDMKLRPFNIPTDEPPRNCGFHTASGKGIAISVAALHKAKALLSECAEDENMKKNTEDKIITSVLSSGKKRYVSSNALTEEKACLHECDNFEDQKSDAPRTRPVQPPPQRNVGFQTASGKGVAISTRALQKAKALWSENDKLGDAKDDTVSVDHPKTINAGFQTASGKEVAISPIALQRAKNLFSEFGEIQHEKEMTSDTKIETQNLPSRNDGPFIASGKQLNSPEALEKSKVPAVSAVQRKRTAANLEVQNETEEINCGFTTARGITVHVSEKNLLKARNILNDSANKDVLDKVSSTSALSTTSEKNKPSQHSTFEELKSCATQNHKTDHVKAYRNPGMSCSKSSVAFKERSTCENGPEQIKSASLTHERHMQVENGSVEDCEKVTHPSPSAGGSPVLLNFGSLGLSGCTMTQQRYFAQEAIDCAKALLEDEEVADRDLAEIPKKILVQGCSEGSALERRDGAKRSAEYISGGDPPLKRRLLEEFDRTVDDPKFSALYPAKSDPDGEIKDRRVFKYITPLRPRITTPYRDGKSSADYGLHKAEPQPTKPPSIPGAVKPTHFKMGLFVPPFQKNMRTGSPQGEKRTPAVFVPPFKKQRTSVQDSSPRIGKEENRHKLCGTPKNIVFVPPAKKSQIPTKVAENESREAMPTVVSEEVERDGLKSLSSNHEVKGDAAEETVSVDIVSGDEDIAQSLQSLELARDMQDMRIRKKKRQNIRPIAGSLFLAKTSGVERIHLRTAVNGQPPAKHTQQQLYVCGVHRHVSEITSDNADAFRFRCRQFFPQQVFVDGNGVQIADGGWLIPRSDGTAGKEEFYKALCDTPGVDPKLISEEWVYNHYRFIVWKQASMERSFPTTMGSLCLTPEQVLLQLKYRYDVEVDHSRRPALRKIMERDDASAKTLVLCVCGVVSRGHDPTRPAGKDVDVDAPQGDEAKVELPVAVLWLTDGWYAIKAQVDAPLTAMLRKGRLAVGVKLMIHGAELVGSQDACSPLDAPESLMMKISANSCRPARWDTKLGFYRDPRPFLLPMSSLYSNGGPVGCVDIVVLRSYPILWMEKKPDGGFAFRSDRAEEKEARRFNSEQQKAMEILFAKIQAEFESLENDNGRPCGRRPKKTLSRQDVKTLHDGEELHEAVENDPVYLEGHLSEQQLDTLNAYRRALADRKQTELQERCRRAIEDAQEGQGGCPKRDVTPVWKLCVADSRDQLGGNVYLLNIWRPSLDLQCLLKEGGRYKVYNLNTSEGKKRPGCATVQLTATKKTQFQDLQVSQEWLSAHFRPRTSANVLDLQRTRLDPLCGEVDLVGYVICITDGQNAPFSTFHPLDPRASDDVGNMAAGCLYSNAGFSPVIYMADGQLNFVKVRCSSSLVQSGLEDLVKPLALLALSNLQLKPQPSAPIAVLHAGDQALFSTNPKESHLQEAVAQLRNLVQGQEDFFKNAEEKLSHFIQFEALSSSSSPALQPTTPAYKMEARSEVRSQRPSRSFGSFTPLGRTPTLAKSSAEKKDPKSLKRKRALDYLSHIPSPPALCPVGTMASPCVNKTFNPPRRAETPTTSTLKSVQTPTSTLKTVQTPARKSVLSPPAVDEWVNDEELAMIDTQALHSEPC